ncbi:hypothetical protein [Staphylococcus hyicus]|uniref:hypothetical protein n=1 Tax=Staphylococcus hyicus TaxID=1284 RepID=UPI003B75BB87
MVSLDKQQAFKDLITELKNKNTDEFINKITDNLEQKFKIPVGVTRSFTARNIDKKFFEKTDIRLISLFVLEALEVMNREKFIDEIFTKGEINEIKQYDFHAYNQQDAIKLPYTFQPCIPVNTVYSTKISVKEISEFVNAGIINYNFDIQREAKLEIRTNKIVKNPTLNRRNIKEMENLLLKDALKESTLYFNAAPLTSHDGDELVYDPNDFSLTITEGTRIDVIDGFHRVLAAQNAYRINPSIEFEFNVVFSNFTTSEAINWQSQHSKATPWSRNRVAELQQESRGARIIKAIKAKDIEFEKLITSGARLNYSIGLVSFKKLAEFIDELFTVENRSEEVKVSEEIAQLLLSINEIRQVSSWNTQLFIYGCLKEYVEDFNRDTDAYLQHLQKLYKALINNKVNLNVDTNLSENTIKREAYNQLKQLQKELD